MGSLGKQNYFNRNSTVYDNCLAILKLYVYICIVLILIVIYFLGIESYYRPTTRYSRR